MNYSTFWTLIRKHPDQPQPVHILPLLPESILELTADGMALLWPINPDRSDKCRYCRHSRGVSQDAFDSKQCVAPSKSSFSCNFVAAQDAEHQDLASYLLDGDFQDAGGYFYSLKSFLSDHNLSEQDLTIIPLGEHPGIASARIAHTLFLSALC